MTTLDDFNIIDIVVKNVNDFKAQNRPNYKQKKTPVIMS